MNASTLNARLFKGILILFMSCLSVAAQINLKTTSKMLPVNMASAKALGVLGLGTLIARAGFLSGLSLLVGWYAYRRFGFLEMIIAQSFTYVVALMADTVIFNNPLQWNRVIGVGFIMAGIVAFNFE